MGHGGVRHPRSYRLFCNLRFLHSPALYRQRNDFHRTLLSPALHAHSHPGSGRSLRVPFVWAASHFLGRALRALGVPAVEPGLRRDLLRRLSPSALAAQPPWLEEVPACSVCGGRGAPLPPSPPRLLGPPLLAPCTPRYPSSLARSCP